MRVVPHFVADDLLATSPAPPGLLDLPDDLLEKHVFAHLDATPHPAYALMCVNKRCHALVHGALARRRAELLQKLPYSGRHLPPGFRPPQALVARAEAALQGLRQGTRAGFATYLRHETPFAASATGSVQLHTYCNHADGSTWVQAATLDRGLQQQCLGATPPVKNCHLSPSGRLLLVTQRQPHPAIDRTQVIDLHTEACLATLEPPPRRAWAPFGDRLATAVGRQLRLSGFDRHGVWQSTVHKLPRLRGQPLPMFCWSPDGRYLAVQAGDERRIYDHRGTLQRHGPAAGERLASFWVNETTLWSVERHTSRWTGRPQLRAQALKVRGPLRSGGLPELGANATFQVAGDGTLAVDGMLATLDGGWLRQLCWDEKTGRFAGTHPPRRLQAGVPATLRYSPVSCRFALAIGLQAPQGGYDGVALMSAAGDVTRHDFDAAETLEMAFLAEGRALAVLLLDSDNHFRLLAYDLTTGAGLPPIDEGEIPFGLSRGRKLEAVAAGQGLLVHTQTETLHYQFC